MALSQKGRAFIEEYLADFNATAAAIRAGYSQRSAAAIGWENLRKPEIRDAIARRIADRTMTADEALIRLAAQARGSMALFVDAAGIVDMEAVTDLQAGALVRRYKDTNAGGIEIELYSSQAALKIILDHQTQRGSADNPIHIQHNADALAAAMGQIVADTIGAAKEAASGWNPAAGADGEAAE
jgi:phage terminase small subunit